mmetsp:Transcript_10561/g.29832  ORF Transcript_10561/g.29832 Transcript_10561/m.29832 type:complete len:157 (-) Transcript_10561:480-950(-)
MRGARAPLLGTEFACSVHSLGLCLLLRRRADVGRFVAVEEVGPPGIVTLAWPIWFWVRLLLDGDNAEAEDLGLFEALLFSDEKSATCHQRRRRRERSESLSDGADSPSTDKSSPGGMSGSFFDFIASSKGVDICFTKPEAATPESTSCSIVAKGNG